MRFPDGYIFTTHLEGTTIRVKERELVMCRSCKYWQDNNGGYPHPDCRWGHDETPDADDYCSFAEKIDSGRESHV